MGRLARLAALCLLTAGWFSAIAATPMAVFSLNEESFARVRKQHPLASADVNDPVYKRTQRYQGFLLSDVLRDLTPAGHPETDLYVRFRCKDGYLPIMPLARAMAARGLIAIRDANAASGQDWQALPGTGTPSTPAPGYLVWPAPPGDVEEYPWPYQMVAIELVTSSDALADLNPDVSEPGHQLFVAHCLKCHAINGVGGTFAPELNSPCSVTEYWNPRLLSRFIANAPTIRAATKMPGFTSLPATDIQLIVDYLHAMASHKSAGPACP